MGFLKFLESAGGGTLAGTGLSALAGLLAPNPYKQKEKWDARAQQRDLDFINQNLKPKREQTDIAKNLGAFSDLISKLLVGSASDRFGGKAGGYGIDFGSLLAGLKPADKPVNPNLGGSGDYADAIMKKYGMER